MLEVKNVKLTYFSTNGETQAIDNISFEVNKGEFVALLGPSGCGKTTLLSIISGLIAPTSGEVIIGGEKVQLHHNKTGYMFQRDHLFEWRTVRKNIRLGLEINKHIYKKNIYKQLKKQTKQKSLQSFINLIKNTNKQYKLFIKQKYDYADNLLKKYGLWDFKDKYPNELSGGMRQRVALIRTLALDPDILLLDEPFSALDYQTRLNLCDDVSNIIKNEGKTTILVTHDITEALSMANKIIVLTKRPAKIKSVYMVNEDNNLTPLQRRESGKFLNMFDTIWKELQSDDHI